MISFIEKASQRSELAQALRFAQGLPVRNVYDNFGGNSDSDSNNPFIPQLWANESLAILEENMIAAQLVHRK